MMMAVAVTLGVKAQTALEEIKANKFLAASNYLDYDNNPATKPLTPSPQGYEPYLMNHYGRHGARWLISEQSFTKPIATMEKARTQAKLTALGEDVLRKVEEVYATSYKRLGDLSTVGERQHHGIGKRMAEHFPEIFKAPGVPIDARSTVVIRCILSMVAECEELAAANPTARFHNDASESLQYYLNQPSTPLLKDVRKKTRQMRRELTKEWEQRISPDRLMAQLFNDRQYAADSIDGRELMSQLFEVLTNVQSHEAGLGLLNIFTDEELYAWWRIRNMGWYLDYAAAPQGGSVQPFSQKNLLKDIIQVADTTQHTAAVLRFGHEVIVMPLACLLEMGNCGLVTENLETLDEQWRNYDIFPMGCNIQLVFYRPTEGRQGDILVKALLNEREVTMPVSTTQYPYYRWEDLRQYYTEKLARYEAQEQAFKESE